MPQCIRQRVRRMTQNSTTLPRDILLTVIQVGIVLSGRCHALIKSNSVRRRSMTVASLPATSRPQISRYNGNPDAFESGLPAKSWASPTHAELLASIYPPVAPLSHVPGAAAPTNVTTISFANGANPRNHTTLLTRPDNSQCAARSLRHHARPGAMRVH